MILAALALAAQTTVTPAAAAAATPATVEAANEPRLQTAAQLLRDRQPQAALDIVTIALADYAAAYGNEKRRIYCAMSPTETLLYMGMAAKDRTDAIAVAPGYCTALYLKGFALVDLGRVAEAKATYRQVLALAPMHAQYLTELGQMSRLDKDWPTMLSLCEEAQRMAGVNAPDVKTQQEGSALRCQGYALVEEGKWGEAEKRYRAALTLDPKDAKAEGELRYIAQHRGDAAKP